MKDYYFHEDKNSGSSTHVRHSMNGDFVVTVNSRYQGTVDGRAVQIPGDLLPEYRNVDLSAEVADGRTAGMEIALWLRDAELHAGTTVTSKLRVLRRGVTVL